MPAGVKFGGTDLIGLIVAVSFAAGLNLYATVATLGLLAHAGVLDLPSGLHLLTSWWVIAASGALFAVEFFADKIPGVDTLWDLLHTVVRIPAGAAEQLHRALREACAKALPSLVKTHGQVDQLLLSDLPLGVLADIVGYMLDIPIAEKAALLAETNAHHRAKTLLDHLARAAADVAPGSAGALEFPPAFSEN